jgi:hypothetical protein
MIIKDLNDLERNECGSYGEIKSRLKSLLRILNLLKKDD